MSAPFDRQLGRVAKSRGRERAETVEFRYRRRYNLTENDPRFLDATVEDMMVDLYAHHFFENPKQAEEYEDADFDLNAELAAIEAEAEAGLPGGDDADWEGMK